MLVNEEFGDRLLDNYNPEQRDLFIAHEDLAKICGTLLDLKNMND